MALKYYKKSNLHLNYFLIPCVLGSFQWVWSFLDKNRNVGEVSSQVYLSKGKIFYRHIRDTVFLLLLVLVLLRLGLGLALDQVLDVAEQVGNVQKLGGLLSWQDISVKKVFKDAVKMLVLLSSDQTMWYKKLF